MKIQEKMLWTVITIYQLVSVFPSTAHNLNSGAFVTCQSKKKANENVLHTKRVKPLYKNTQDDITTSNTDSFKTCHIPLSTKRSNHPNSNVYDRRNFLSSMIIYTTTTTTGFFLPTIANAATIKSKTMTENDDNGLLIDMVTQSDIGVATRQAAVRGAQIVDKLDEKWERFSDSLRDRQKCDASTNRRLFDNGFRKDGTRIGNPVLGGLCTPVPLKPLDSDLAQRILQSGERVLLLHNIENNGGNDNGNGNGNGNTRLLEKAMMDVSSLVGPSFRRAAAVSSKENQETDIKQIEKRRSYNEQLYIQMRASSDLLFRAEKDKLSKKEQADISNQFELDWGKQILNSNIIPALEGGGILSPFTLSKANRESYYSPFPKLTEDEKIDLNYNEDSLLDALGSISVVLQTLQDGGLIGNWEISTPVDDFGEVVTIAVDDDISLGAQVLLREQQRQQRYLSGSAVIGIIRASLWNSGIICGLDSFFIDPSTTKQDIYNPTQLLVNLSNIRTR